MDAPAKKPGMMILLQIPTNNGFSWFQSGAGFRPPTVPAVQVWLHARTMNLNEGPFGHHVRRVLRSSPVFQSDLHSSLGIYQSIPPQVVVAQKLES